jgi:hypothetical protein
MLNLALLNCIRTYRIMSVQFHAYLAKHEFSLSEFLIEIFIDNFFDN